PIGGVKEKLLAAHRAGITHVLLPVENEKDLEEIPPNVLSGLRIDFVDHMDQVLAFALHPEPLEKEDPIGLVVPQTFSVEDQPWIGEQ
ncbi:MAG: endopeptidase La, partial [Firmicutes bacterium]|nr:endopeptidase La [Bacillota bacterium]